MADNILTLDRDGNDIALAAKDDAGVLVPRNLLTDTLGNDITPLTDEALRAAPVPVTVSNPTAQGLTDEQLRAAPVESIPSSSAFIESVALRALAKLTYSLTGQRVDCGGSSVTIGSGTVTAVTTVGTTNLLAAIGYNTQSGQAIQQSQLAYQCGFRRNIS